MIYFRAGTDDSKKYIIIETDNPSVPRLLEYTVKDTFYNCKLKSWDTRILKKRIYEKKHHDKDTGHTFYLICSGWAAYILMMFKDMLFPEDYAEVMSAVCRETYRDQPFQELRDIQNQDVLHLLKYRRGLMSVYTGYGKTQIISVLAKYYNQDLGKKVLIVTPQTKPRDEIVKRLKNMYGLDVSIKGKGDLQAMITAGLMNRSLFKDKTQEAEFIKELESFDVVLVDEVEYTINPAGCYVYDHIKPEVLYGFSGTSDKKSGKMINFLNGLSDPSVYNNSVMIKYFGPSLVYRQPLDLKVSLIHIKSESMNNSNLKLWDVPEESGNLYLEMMTRMFTNPAVCKTIVEIVKKFPILFIPINNLQNIIYEWINNYFLGVFRVLLVCYEGYLYYDLDGNKTALTLQEACDKIRAGEVDVIPSTSSGFRALDFPCLSNILLFAGKIAGSVLQAIGRIARQNHMNIIEMVPLDGKSVPIHTKTMKIREDLIREYYKYCKIEEKDITEEELKRLP